MAHLLCIVSRARPGAYAYLKHVFASDTVDVLLDRRVGERRRRQAPAAFERRRADRRQRDVTVVLETFGWTLVRR